MSEIEIILTEEELLILHSLVHELYKKAHEDFSFASVVKDNDFITALQKIEEKLSI